MNRTHLGIAVVIILAIVHGWFVVGIEQTEHEQATENITVTCYVESNQTAENLSANAHCPSPLKTDAEWIHIEVEPCRNYTFANDEPHPCQ